MSSNATVAYGGKSRTYVESLTSNRTGGPDGWTHNNSRSVTDISLAQRNTTVTATFTPMIQNGEVVSMTANLASNGVYPSASPSISDMEEWEEGGGQGNPPRTVVTTVNMTHNSTISRTANGLSGTVTTHTREFGDGVTREYFDDSWSLTLTGNTITGSHSMKYQKGGQTHTLVVTLNGLHDPQTFDFSGTVNITEDGQPKGSYSFYIDGFWGNLWHAAASIVTGAACFVATSAVAASTGVATAVTFGAAGTAALVGTALTASTCAFVSAKVYDATK